ncbi:unnamed protein product [Rangifer tarandus platyrhynchus]|uniref:Uncharacterized protein n=1 Tax=Rangifer tarandus platyrhynchus TaxID=3082113 RepID=A0AC59ZFW6_RANTA
MSVPALHNTFMELPLSPVSHTSQVGSAQSQPLTRSAGVPGLTNSRVPVTAHAPNSKPSNFRNEDEASSEREGAGVAGACLQWWRRA